MGRYIPDDVIEEIRSRADIVDVVSSYVPQLKRYGATWKACCPFHQEKTPSFIVNPSRQAFHCFGCQKGGNVFTFVMELEKLDFPNAVELLARKYHVLIPEPEPRYGRGRGGSDAEGGGGVASSRGSNYSLRERLFLLHENLASWYARQLREHPDSAVALYLKTRGIPLEFVNRFGLGASPDSWDAAMNWAAREGFSKEELRESGLVSEGTNGNGRVYDRFRNRLMFPIWNEQGRVVAFSARTIESGSSGAKYVNSPETLIFKKSRILYALHFARTAIHEKGYAVLCEGQLDVIAMHRAGCTNAVAPQGTAFGADQASVLKRYTDSVYLALDNDGAGEKAVFKDASILLPLGMKLKVVRYSGAKDADEVLSSQGPEALLSAVENAVDFFHFALDRASEGKDLSSPSGKAEAAAFVIGQILLLDSSVAQDLYLSWLAERLGISAEAVGLEFRRRREIQEEHARRQLYREQLHDMGKDLSPGEGKKRNSSTAAAEMELPPPLSERNPRLKKAMCGLFSLMLSDETLAGIAESEIPPEMLDRSPLSEAIEMAMQTKYDGEWGELGSNILARFEKEGVVCPEVTALLVSSSPSGEEEGESAAPDDDGTAASPPPSAFSGEDGAENGAENPGGGMAGHGREGEVLSGEHSGGGGGKTKSGNGKKKRSAASLEKEFADYVKVIKQIYYQEENRRILKEYSALPPGEERDALARKAMEYSRLLIGLSKKKKKEVEPI